MKPRDYDLWCLRRQLTGETLNGEVETVSESLRPLAEHLNSLKTPTRKHALDGWLVGRPDREALLDALANINPKGPPPEAAEEDDGPISAAELLRDVAGEPWHWNLWLGQAALTGIAAAEGVGKSRLMFDLMRRAYLNEAWPDGSPMTFPKGTRTLWVCADGNHEELAREADRLGILDAVLFNGSRDQPYGHTDFDESETLERLDRNIEIARPGLVAIDTLTNATSSNLCSQSEVKTLMTPLRDMAKRHRVPVLLLMHLNRDGNVLGRRMRGWCRSILKLECPDEDQPTRLRLEVFKSYAKRPDPIGVTLGDDGNAYSMTSVPGKAKGGRPATEISKAREVVLEALHRQNDQAGSALASLVEARNVASSKTGWNAINALEAEGLVIIDETRRPKIVHLNDARGEGADNAAF